MFSPKPRKSVSFYRNVCLLAIVAAIFALSFASAAHAQTFTVLHSFTGGGDGSAPTGLTLDQAGNIYGASKDYPNPGSGLVFKMVNGNAGWTLVPLHNFGIPSGDGLFPNGVVIGPDGKLYGTTTDGGSGDAGTVFRLSPPASVCRTVLCLWIETSLADFFGTAYPENADLAFDQEGNIYGTTPFGGDDFHNCPELGCGMAYELSPVGGDTQRRSTSLRLTQATHRSAV